MTVHPNKGNGSKSRILYALLTILGATMIFGAISQLFFLRQIEDPGRASWKNDEHAIIFRTGLVKPEVLSWSPRIILLHNFLSPEECAYLMALAKPKLTKSTVVDASTGKGVESRVRTSSGMFLNGQDRQQETIQAIEKRIALYSMIPEENGELLQILRYENGQFYLPHHDFFSDSFNLKRGGQRVATMLMYLETVEEGGETIFPTADGTCNCGGEQKQGMCIKPMKGDAILFWSLNLDGSIDSKSLHGSCSVLKGEKWSATKWLRQYAFS